LNGDCTKTIAPVPAATTGAVIIATSAFGGTTDKVGLAADSTRSRMTQHGHYPFSRDALA
jgi:hypothetical protein